MTKKLLYCLIGLIGQSAVLFGQHSVTFQVAAPSIQKNSRLVFLAGDFNGWNAGDTAWQLKPVSNSDYLNICQPAFIILK